jgi:hypothetical protein
MNPSNRPRSRPSSLARNVVVVTVAAIAAFLLAMGPAAADTIQWTGGGTTNGLCNNVSGSGSQQTWHFVLTSPGPGPWELTATFADSGVKTDAGAQQGNGSVFFFVTTSAGDTLQSASATNGTANSQLTVSDCVLSGPPPTTAPPTTAPSTTVKPPSPPSPPPGPAVPTPAAAVSAAATLTG